MSDGIKSTRTFDQACRLLMLDMLWKALDRALNLSQAAAQGDAALRAFFCCAPFRAGTLGPASQIAPFRSIDAVGSELLTRPLEHIDCDTHQRTPKNSSIKLSKVRDLDML